MSTQPTDAMPLCPFCDDPLKLYETRNDETFHEHEQRDCPLSGYRFSPERVAIWSSRTPPPCAGDDVERVAAAIKPNLFKFYPGGKSEAHERARQMARAAIAALGTTRSETPK